MDLDDFKLPPLEEVLGRVEGEKGSESDNIIPKPRFYDSTCAIKEEEDGRGKIQIENRKKYPSIVCRYYNQGNCKVCDVTLCAHHYP
ncbi:hypothetical protein K8R30_02350 [archaeon]|nr:hypothetical protein [archaeon]